MKGCDVVTVRDGTIQAIKGPIAYFGYHPTFKDRHFAVDAKMFVAALKKFKSDFFVAQNDDKVIFYDDRQEVDFLYQPAEIILDQSRIDWHSSSEFSKAWNITQKFVETDFPGVRIKPDYLEVLSDASIVRVSTATMDLNGIFSAIKLPAGIVQVGQYNGKLWFGVTPVDRIAVNSLDVDFPSTDGYFTNWPEDKLEPIPDLLRERFVETDLTAFDEEGVKFVQKEKATASIENISGIGSYRGKLFSNIITYATRYAFLDRYVAFAATGIKGVVARV